MVKVSRSTVLDHPVDAVWGVLRDFNGHEEWHPAIASSQIERNEGGDRVACVRRFKLADGGELREQLLTLSDLEQSYSYCLLDTPVPLFNYVSHVSLTPVTDGDGTYWSWKSEFSTQAGRESEMAELVGEGIYQAGFDAIRDLLDREMAA